MYRAWYDADLVKNDPEMAWIIDDTLREGYDMFNVYLNGDIHFMLSTVQYGRAINWATTHRVSPPSHCHGCSTKVRRTITMLPNRGLSRGELMTF